MNIAIIIPAYNEERNIIKLIKEIKKYIKPTIVIVDDSNNNLTKDLFKKKRNNIHYFHRTGKKGRGSAVIYGLKKILKKRKFDIFIEMDADMSHKPSELVRNINYFKKNSLDMLISSRYLNTSVIRNWSISRKFLSYLSNKLARFLLEVPASDYTNGYRIYSKRAAKIIVKKCGRIGDGFIVLSEILLTISKSNYKIGEIDSIFINRERGSSSVSFVLVLQSLYGLFKLYIKNKNKILGI